MCGLRLLRSYICFAVYSDFVKIKVNPQRARRANITVEDNITATQYHAEGISLRKQQGYPSGRFSRRFAPQNDIKCFARKNTLPKKSGFYKCYHSLKSQNFDGFSGFSTGSCEGAYLAYVTEQGSVKTPKRRKIMTFYHHLLWTFSANPIISFTSITVPSSRIALPLNFPNT